MLTSLTAVATYQPSKYFESIFRFFFKFKLDDFCNNFLRIHLLYFFSICPSLYCLFFLFFRLAPRLHLSRESFHYLLTVTMSFGTSKHSCSCFRALFSFSSRRRMIPQTHHDSSGTRETSVVHQARSCALPRFLVHLTPSHSSRKA